MNNTHGLYCTLAVTLTGAPLLGACNTNAALARQRAADVKEWNDTQSAGLKAAANQCQSNLTTPELDPIRHKVELWRGSSEAAPRSRSHQTTPSLPTPSARSLESGRLCVTSVLDAWMLCSQYRPKQLQWR
jgi:hypothetical protein